MHHLLVSRHQSSNESIAEYLQALKTLSKDCTFGNVTAQQYQEELVCNSFINGLSSAFIQQCLLENDELSIDHAFKLADNLDRTYQHAVSLNTFQMPSAGYHTATTIPLERSTLTKQSSEKFKDKSEIFAASTKKIQHKCYFCSGPMHTSRAMCPAKNAVCHGCGKQGHYIKVCRKIKSNTAAASSLSEFDHNLETVWRQPLLASVVATAPKCLSHALIKMKMKGKEVDVLIDSGASGNFIDSKLAAELKITVHGGGSEISMASQELVANTHESLKTSILVLNHSYLLDFEVIDKLCTDVILGQDFLRKHSEVTFCMGGSDPPLKRNDNQLNDAVAKVEAPRLFKFLSPDCKPVALPSRVYCKKDQDFIKTKVKRFLKEDIIETSRPPL